MTDATKEFLKNNLDLIDNNEFSKLYKQAPEPEELTDVLLASEINPLDYMTEVPNYYACNSSIQSITLPEHVQNIGRQSFAWCKNLTDVEFSSSIYYIGEEAFLGCSSLKHIGLPDHLMYVSLGSFAGTAIEHIVIPPHLKVISYSCFKQCTKLKTVTLGDSVVSIQPGAFTGCKELHTIVMNSNLSTISDYAFQDCKQLKKIHIPESVTKISQFAFFNINPVIVCKEGSAAEQFAKKYKYNYQLI